MHGIQIEQLLNIIEDQVTNSRPIVRREIIDYIVENEDTVLKDLAMYGEVNIPTSYGAIRLTKEDLTLAAA